MLRTPRVNVRVGEIVETWRGYAYLWNQPTGSKQPFARAKGVCVVLYIQQFYTNGAWKDWYLVQWEGHVGWEVGVWFKPFGSNLET